ncbi:hypothetical protein LZ554_004720 [Drepanopeziza brunnea f. sp. 'monogermtubi']|nr:hypothetical protein LZ554_004720 [Drepanopeziza brunnea f. sp. 'monogermtubi']
MSSTSSTSSASTSSATSQLDTEPLHNMASPEIISPKPIRRVRIDALLRLAVAIETVDTVNNFIEAMQARTSKLDELLVGSVPDFTKGDGRLGAIGCEQSGKFGVNVRKEKRGLGMMGVGMMGGT